jgi:polyhydroxybutyrate depolymerase
MDRTRIYATGISNGGMMAFALACNTATFAAIGTDSATQLDQCAPPVVSTDGPVTTSTAGCADGRGVVLITVDGGGHEWPTFATQRLWDFFSAHPA